MTVKSLAAFAQALKGGAPKVALVLAVDHEDQKKAIRLFSEFGSLSSVDGDQFSKEKFLEESENIDLFSKRRILIIDQAHLLKKEELSIINTYLDRPHPNITLLLVASQSLTPKITQTVATTGLVLTLLEEKAWDKKARLIHEVIHYLQKEKVRIDPKVCAFFIDSLAGDQLTIQQELDKLLCYIGDRDEITKEDITTICSTLFSQTIWNLVDAIYEQRFSEALYIGTHLVETSSIHYLFATLRTQLHNGYEILSLYHSEGKEAVTKRFAYLKGTLLDKKISLLQKYGMASFKEALNSIFEGELQARENSMDEQLILEILLVRLCRC